MDLAETISIVMRKAAMDAGEHLMTLFQTELSTSDKTSHKDIVTKADTESQQIIQSTIRRRLMQLGYEEDDLGFVGEEGLHKQGKYTFIIDPLDGTTNFAAGIPFFCVSIACVRNGEVFSGIIYDPVRKRYYSANSGKGAFVSSVETKVNPFSSSPGDSKTLLRVTHSPLKKSVIAAHVSSAPEIQSRLFRTFEKLSPEVRALRDLGALALDLAVLAENVFGGVINGKCYIWDIAAASLILKESGAVMTDWEGNPVELEFDKPDKMYQIIACEKTHLPTILGAIKNSRKQHL